MTSPLAPKPSHARVDPRDGERVDVRSVRRHFARRSFRRRASVPAALTLGLTLGLAVFALSLIGGGSLVRPAEAQSNMFTPDVSITVPFIDSLDPDGDHDFSGEHFRIGFTRNGSDNDANCTEEVDAKYEINDQGEVELRGTFGADRVSVNPGLSLVSQHSEPAVECRYTVNFRPNGDFEEDTASTTRDTQITGSDASAQASYGTSRAGKTAVFTLLPYGVPDGVSFLAHLQLAANAHAGCSESVILDAQRRTSVTLTVGTGGSGRVGFTDWPKGWLTAADRCVWMPVWPQHEEGGTTLYGQIARPAGAQEPVTDLRDTANQIYYRGYYGSPRTTFGPSVSVSVPYDDDGAGGNRFAGETLTISYRRVAGQANESDCTSSATDTFTIASGGSAQTGGVLTRGAVPTLVNRPETRSTECEYTATASTTTQRAGGDGQLTRVGDASARINHNGLLPGGGPASFAYESVFTAEIDIQWPPGTRPKLGEVGFEAGDITYKGATFGVTFTRTQSSPATCLANPRTVTFEVPDSEVAGLTVTGSLTFVDRVGGETNPCEYTAGFPSTVTEGTSTEAIGYVLQVDDTNPVIISAANRTATRRYTLVDDLIYRLFNPPIEIEAPPTAAPGLSTSLYSGKTIDVAYASTGGAHCTPAQPNVTYIASPSTLGGFNPDGNEVVLVNQRANDPSACSYTVTVPSVIDSDPGATPAWQLTLNGSNTATFNVNSPQTIFTYEDTTPVAPVDPGNGGTSGGDPGTSGGNGGTGGTQTGGGTSGDNAGTGGTGNTQTGGTQTGGTGGTQTGGTGGTQIGGTGGTQTGGNTGGTTGGTNGGTGNGDTGNTQTGGTGGTNTGGTGNTGTPTVNPPAPTVPTGGGSTTRRPVSSSGGGGSSRTTGGGSSGGGGSRTTGGGSSGGSSGGSAATGPWVVAATSRVPVAVSLAMPQRDFPVGTAIEVMLNVPGDCGEDVTAFAGLPANVGLVYALSAQSGTTAQVLAAGALSLAGYAERGDQTSDCEVRITLITAPAGCTLSDSQTDDAGRSFVELTGGRSTTSYAASPSLVCR